jgi:hypothetical protein
MARTKPITGTHRTPAKVRHPVNRPLVVHGKQPSNASPVKRNLWFNSRTTGSFLSYLSNFTVLPGGACLPRGLCLVPPSASGPGLELSTDVTSVEAGLVDAKITLAQGTPAAKAAARAVAAAAPSGAALKNAGRRTAFKRVGLALDAAVYDAAMPQIMEALLRARARVDPEFCATVRSVSTPQDGTVCILRHFARGLHHRTKDDGVYTREGSVAARNAEALGPLIQAVVAQLDLDHGAGAAPGPALART